MSRRKPVKPQPQSSGSSIEISAAHMLLILIIAALAGGGLWWWRHQRGAGQPAAGNGASVATAVSAPAENAATAGGDASPPGALSPLTATASSDPDAAAWTTPEGHPAVGREDAPVTIVVYSDYQCPNCRQFALEVMPWLRQTWVQRGLVRVVYRDFVLRGEGSQRAAEAAQCASDQHHFWRYHDELFANQPREESAGAFPLDMLKALGQTIGLDAQAFGDCMQAHRFAARVDDSTQVAKDQKFDGTPTFLVNGRKTQGAIAVAEWDKLFKLYEAQFAAGGSP